MGARVDGDGIGDRPKMMVIETDHLIVGTGPAGASLACFLSSYGLKGIMVGAASGSAETPRAHITNMAALECLRDIGLEEDCMKLAVGNESMLHTRWCKTLAGEEYARIYSWGNDPKRKGDYDAASPCKHVDLPQTLLEPLLVRHAVLKGFKCRFDTTFLSFAREPSSSSTDEAETILSLVQDNLIGQTYAIRSKYLFGCDGARSRVLRELKIPLLKKPGQGLAINVLVKADLSRHMENRIGNLHWVMQPETEHPDFGWTALVRMVKPWFEWMFILFPDRNAGNEFPTSNEQYLKRIKEFIGDGTIEVEILNVSKWAVNETVAEYYSKGNIFCLGDAVHRHPPMNGLGSNTCIQDAFNLAWKIAYATILPLPAKQRLLETFSKERQPVGEAVITRANDGVRQHGPVWEALGMLDPSVEVRRQQFSEFKSPSREGRERRRRLRMAIEMTAHEFHGLGIEMNQRLESTAIVHDDEAPRPPLPEDPILFHEITTYPGSRLPHAWLNTRSPGKQISTIDLAGNGKFCLLTGIGGEKWKAAVRDVSSRLGLEGRIIAYSIGWGCDYEDVYFDWARHREIDEDGCVLVRPDRYVCWRSFGMTDNAGVKLEKAMRKILGIYIDSI